MKKRFLGIICLLYSGIIIYVWTFGKLKNFLAPSMQIYLKLSLIPLLIMGLILCFNGKVKYKFKVSDSILILPLILLILAGDGRLTATFATNRNVNLKKDKEVTEDVNEEVEEFTEEELQNFDFSNIDYEVVDEAYDSLATYITYTTKPDHYVGKTIKVRGFTLKNSSYLPDNYFMIGKYSISCCAADAGFMGFFVKYDLSKIKEDAWYEIEGVLEKGRDKENLEVMVIRVVSIKEIDSKDEEQYIYPCYVYDNGECKVLDKYNIE